MTATTYDHFQRNGQWVKRPLTTRRVIDRLTTPTARTTYKGEGIGLGAWVSGDLGRYSVYAPRESFGFSGQVWCEAGTDVTNRLGKGYWWVATETGYVLAYEGHLTLTGQAEEPLFEQTA